MSSALSELDVAADTGIAIVRLRIAGRLEPEDYEQLESALSHAMDAAPGKPRMLIILDDLEGMTPAAVWEDIKFDMRHCRDIGRLAIVGDSTLQKVATILFKPFTTADVRWFDMEDLQAAESWVTI